MYLRAVEGFTKSIFTGVHQCNNRSILKSYGGIDKFVSSKHRWIWVERSVPRNLTRSSLIQETWTVHLVVSNGTNVHANSTIGVVFSTIDDEGARRNVGHIHQAAAGAFFPGFEGTPNR